MDFTKKIYGICLLILLTAAVPSLTYGQFSIGASYQIRNEEPKNGFGVHLSKGILQQIPLVDLNLRAHFSYFNKDNYVGKEGTSYGKIKNYNYGLMAIGGISVGLLEPYIGAGLGSTTLDLNGGSNGDGGKDTDLFWNGLVGAKISPVPILKPFVEYRFRTAGSLSSLKNKADRSNGRIVFGLSLSF